MFSSNINVKISLESILEIFNILFSYAFRARFIEKMMPPDWPGREAKFQQRRDWSPAANRVERVGSPHVFLHSLALRKMKK